MPTVTQQQLVDAGRDTQTIADIANSEADTTIDRPGRMRRTLTGVINWIMAQAQAVLGGLGYLPPVAYAAGISIANTRQTVTYLGVTYAANADAVPFTTSGTFETAKFRVIQGVTAADLGSGSGALLVGTQLPDLGATVVSLSKLLEYVPAAPSRFGAFEDGTTDDTAAIQAAIDSGQSAIEIRKNTRISSTLNLRSNQTLYCSGSGKISALASFAGSNGMLFATGKDNVNLDKVVVDASATSGIIGINFFNCNSPTAERVRLLKCNINLNASDNTTERNYRIVRPSVDLAGWNVTALYVSKVNGVDVQEPNLTGGKEGVGVYNQARALSVYRGRLHDFTGDGFVVIDGQDIDVCGTRAERNGQSGFTTQRQTAASNCRNVRFRGAMSSYNTFDGFDIRGGDPTLSFSAPMSVTLDGCFSSFNSGTGVYLVYAPGVIVSATEVAQNALQGLYVDNSDNAVLAAVVASSNANAVASAGPNKSGILIYNSSDVSLGACRSGNDLGATQDYGLGISGSSIRVTVAGGNYRNNSLGTIYEGAQMSVAAVQANTSAAGVFLFGIAQSGMRYESGFGVPTHVSPKGSIFSRVDGGGGEIYISDGGGVWYSR